MLLRPYQKRLVIKAKAALKKSRNTLAVAATGAGKTIMLAALAREIGGKTLILQHRQELLDQNMSKFKRVNPDWDCSIFDAKTKSMSGDAVFASQQTLTRNLDVMPQFDHVIVDETHHIVTPTYANIIDACMERNKKLLLTGFTATPVRGDKKTLKGYFNNVADKITIRELVGLGFLVPPVAYVVDLGVQSRLQEVEKRASHFGDQAEVAEILDTRPINNEVVRHWKEHASDRRTIVFCSTIKHAEDVAEAFRAAGVACESLHGHTGEKERRAKIRRLDNGETQVITNVGVLTEGFDSQPVSCVILLRLCSEKGPMIQMVGRGLRTVDPEIYPGVVKKDCVVIDFGISLITHGNLDQDDGLHDETEPKETEEEGTYKICPEEYDDEMPYRFPDCNGNRGCGSEVPIQSRVCPICGFVFEKLGPDKLENVSLMEMDILSASPFRWTDLFGNDLCLIANGFSAWSGIFSPDHGETWHALGKKNDERKVHRLAVSGRLQAMAMADDFLRSYETEAASKKSRRWLDEPATDKQLAILNQFGYDVQTDILGGSNFTKYSAACHASFQFNRRLIERALGVA